MSRKRIKQYLMLLTVVGLIAVAANGSGTFASFSAETTNDGNTFATGTLFLHNTGGGTTCTSESAASNDNFRTSGCGVLFNLKSIAPGVLQTAHLALANAGTLNASDIKFKTTSGGCVSTIQTIGTLHTAIPVSTTPSQLVIDGLTQTLVSNTVVELNDSAGNPIDFKVTATTASAGAGSTTVPVSGGTTDATHSITASTTAALKTPFTEATPSVCTVAQVTIQETAADYTTTTGTCAYPSGASNCSLSNSYTLSNLPSSFSALNLKSGGGDSNAGTGLDASGGTRYFVISVKVPDTGTNQNSLQNEQATLGLTWHIDQA